MNRSSQRDILAIERVAGMALEIGARDVVFARSIRGHTLRGEGVTLDAGAAGGRIEMNADKDGVRKTIGKTYAVFQGNTNVVHSGHLHSVTGADQFPPGRERDVQRKPFLRAPAARSALIGASVAGIEHHGLDLLRFLNSARAKNRLDDLADIHHRNQVIVAAAAEERKVREKSDTVDRKLAGSRLGTEDTTLAPE